MSKGCATSTACWEGWLRRLASTANPGFRAAYWISAACAWSCSSGRITGKASQSTNRLPGSRISGFALGTADAVDELSGVIAAAGYRVLEPPQRTCEVGCYESVVLDPDGNRLKLTV
jgi:predicted enzyme related to lactoylglutathione lyase